MSIHGKIRVGTASWSDPGFIADWYPPKLPASERLPYYAAHFNLVELNSSFYGIPQRRMVERWCAQTPPGFTFDVKLHKLLSRHATTADALPSALRAKARVERGKVALTPQLEEIVVGEFLAAIKPLREAGKMGALLLQLTPSFSPQKHQLDELVHLLALLSGWPVAVELRNRHWMEPEHLAEVKEFFRSHHLTFVSVDAPRSKHFMVMPGIDLVTQPKLAYLRLHGRNVEGYTRGKTVAERFNYDYSEEELQEIAGRAIEMAEEAAEVHVLYNNNASDYALRAAARFQDIIAEQYPERSALPAPPRGQGGAKHWGRTLELKLPLRASLKNPLLLRRTE